MIAQNLRLDELYHTEFSNLTFGNKQLKREAEGAQQAKRPKAKTGPGTQPEAEKPLIPNRS